jgi:hypothetical protein
MAAAFFAEVRRDDQPRLARDVERHPRLAARLFDGGQDAGFLELGICRLSRGVAVEFPADLLLLPAKTRWVLLQPLALCAHQAGSVVLSHLLL